MNRYNSLVVLFLVFLISCQSETTPKLPPEPEPIQTEISFTPIPPDDGSYWVGEAMIDEPITGTKIQTKPGKGLLVLDASSQEANAYTSPFSHGDIELELEFMLSKGAEASISFLGNIPLSLSDSWQEPTPSASTSGSIMGNAPSLNAALAPGLWQQVRVLFHTGNTTAQMGPTVDKVLMNGVKVQEDLTLDFEEANPLEAALRLTAEKGQIAFRNISYKLYGNKLPSLDSLNYKFYELSSKTTATDYIPDFSALEAADSGPTDSLTKNVTDKKKDFGLTFEGKFIAPTKGKYLFEVRVQGGAILYIDGKEVVNHDGETNYNEGSAFGSVELEAGSHDFRYLYRKEHMQWRQGLGLFVEGPEIEKMALHSEGSVYPPRKHTPYKLAAGPEITLHRSYLMHKGKKLTHAISVGNPTGIHYSYDLNNASLLQMWGGEFMDVRQMWVGRGAEQLAVPMGATLVQAAQPNIAILSQAKSSWPDSLDPAGNITYKGYDIKENGEPVFRYLLGEAELQDHLSANPNTRGLTRTLSLAGNGENKTHVLVAKGKKIHQNYTGTYGVDGYNYYIQIPESSGEPIVRSTASGEELLLPLSPNSSISYTLTW